MLTCIIILALIFGLINGFSDSTNYSVSALVSSKLLTARFAVFWAALFNFIAYFFFKLNIANTVCKDIAHIEVITLSILFSALISSVLWNLITLRFSISTSSSHALLGSFVGAVLAKGGIDAIIYSTVSKIFILIFLAPFAGMITSFFVSTVLINICNKLSYSGVEKKFRYLRFFSAALYGLSQGTNDAQKVMGIIYLALITAGNIHRNSNIPFWVVISCHAAIAAGTLLGGLKIVKNMGQRITHLRTFEGFSAELSGALTLLGTNAIGIPVSTTHVLTGSVIGAGITKRFSAIRWGVSVEIFWAWLLTIPITLMLSAAVYYIFHFFTGF